MTPRDTVYRALADGPSTSADLERATGLTRDEVRAALAYMRRAGWAVCRRPRRRVDSFTTSRSPVWRLVEAK